MSSMKPEVQTRRAGVLPPGWMGKKSRRWLAKRAKKHSRIIEVGCWLGRSTKLLAHYTTGTVWAVDHWQGTPADPEQHQLYAEPLDQRDAYAEFCANLAPEIEAQKVIPVRMSSVEAADHLLAHWGPGSFDWVFIDADHSYEGCAGDIDAYLPLLTSGGLMSGHDYHWRGVAKAVQERFPVLVLGPKSIWSVRV